MHNSNESKSLQPKINEQKITQLNEHKLIIITMQ